MSATALMKLSLAPRCIAADCPHETSAFLILDSVIASVLAEERCLR